MAMLKTVRYRTSGNAAGWGPKGLEDYLLVEKGRAEAVSAQISFEALEVSSGTIDTIQKYLDEGHGRQGRVLAYAHSDYIMSDGPKGWADEMMATKRRWGKTAGRQMYQFVVSPDPRDRVGAQECLELAAAWAQEMYPDGEWIVVVHDDNTHGIVHAHVALNSVLPATGLKVHRDNAFVREEARVLQRLCEERGMSRMPDLEQRRRVVTEAERMRNLQPATVTKEEREMRARGIPCWRADMRDAIDAAARRARDWGEFEAILDGEGISVERKARGGVTYRMDDWRGSGARRLRDCSLGAAYTPKGILGRLNLDFDSMDGIARNGWGRGAGRKPHAKAAPLVPEKLRRAPDANPYARKAPKDLAEAVSMRARYNPGVAAVESLAASMALLSGEKIEHYGQIAERKAALEDELRGIQEEAISYGRAFERAQRAYDAAQDAASARAEISALQDKPTWDAADRTRFRELEARAADGEARAAAVLASARGWAEANGLPPDDSLLVATLLTERVGELAKGSAERLRSVQERLAALSKAERTVGRALFKDPVERSRTQGRSVGKEQPKVSIDMASAIGGAQWGFGDDRGGQRTAQGWNAWAREKAYAEAHEDEAKAARREQAQHAPEPTEQGRGKH